MSTIIMSACWPLGGMNASQKAVLISLADNANDSGVCWPSIKYISERTCLSERAVQGAIKWLVNTGALQVSERQGRSTVYTVTPAEYAPPQEMRGAKTVNTPANSVSTPAESAPTPADAAPRTINNHQGTVKEPLHGGNRSVASAADDPVPALNCPVQKIVDAYHELMPDNPRVRILDDARRRTITSRWKQAAKLKTKPFGYSTVSEGLEAWRTFFDVCNASDFLTGKAPPGYGRDKPFIADLDFLMSPKGFKGCLENKYHREAA